VPVSNTRISVSSMSRVHVSGDLGGTTKKRLRRDRYHDDQCLQGNIMG
jgi:hypothetical protein